MPLTKSHSISYHVLLYIGQSQFAAEVYKRVVQNGHEVVGVFTIPDDKNGREDALATFAAQDGVPVFKYKVRTLLQLVVAFEQFTKY